MTVKLQVRILLALLVSSFLIIGSKAIARGDGWPTNYQHFTAIRELAQSTPAWTHVMFTLTDGTQVFGQLLKYEKYTDYIWYQPNGTGRNWFKQDAFDVHELLRIDVMQEPI